MAGQRSNSALHLVLQDCNLLEYEQLLLEEGADDMTQLKELEEEEFQQLCLMVGMASKPFHVKRLQKALGRPSSQVYAQKRAGSNDPGNYLRTPPASLASNPAAGGVPAPLPPNPVVGGASRLLPPGCSPRASPTAPRLQVPSSQLQLPSSSSSSSLSTPQQPHPHYQQQLQRHFQQHQQLQQQQQQQKQLQQQQQQQQHEVLTAGFGSGPLSSDADPPTLDTGFSHPGTSSKQLFLPHYLHPDSDSKDISPLVDELTPIQLELGPCPFIPRDWDERRADLIRRYAAIYGQGNSKRKNEELSLHEENINVAAFQLCLRDPTLLVRRDELLVMARKAIKDGGYTFQHGLSKAKVAETPSFVGNMRKRPLEKPLLEDNFAVRGFDLPGSGIPLPRNMSREKKLKRVEELEFLITKNKMKQSIKLAALEKSRQGNDFSMSYHLQAEIESLGNTLASLQEEYANMKYRLRRSDRYFEKKQRKDEEEEEEEELVPLVVSPHAVGHAGMEGVQKRIRLQQALGPGKNQLIFNDNQGPSNYQPSFHPSPVASQTAPPEPLPGRSISSSTNHHPSFQPSPAASQTAPPEPLPGRSISSSTNHHPSFQPSPVASSQAAPTQSVAGSSPTLQSSPPATISSTQQGHSPTLTTHTSTNDYHQPNSVASSVALSRVSSVVTSPLSHPHPHSLSPASSPPALLHVSARPPSTTSSSQHHTVNSDLSPIFPQHHPETSVNSTYLTSRPTVMAQVLPQHDSAQQDSHHQQQQQEGMEEDVTSDQLLANINKLATQAAANLRSMPHF